MSTRDNCARDPFRFSLRGLAATAFGGIPYAIGDNGINRVWDEKLRRTLEERPNSAAPGARASASRRRNALFLPG